MTRKRVTDISRINTEITDLESILENNPELNHTREEISELETRLHRLSFIQGLWDEFGNVPMDPETECIEQEWNAFPAGTFREDIWHWFEETFNISVAEDLMYDIQEKENTTKKMKTYTEKVFASYADTSAICNALAHRGFMGENDTVSVTAFFPDGNQMDIKCCGVKDGKAYTEAVLFTDAGRELCCSEPNCEFFTEWELIYNNTRYIVNVFSNENGESEEKSCDVLYQRICDNFTLDGQHRRLVNNIIQYVSKKMPADDQVQALKDLLSPIGNVDGEIKMYYRPMPTSMDQYMKPNRAIALLSGIIEHYAKTEGRAQADVLKWCLEAGFTKDELVRVFHFFVDDVEQAASQIENKG